MKASLIILIITIITFNAAEASVRCIEDNSIFGCYNDSLDTFKDEAYALELIDSLMLANVAEIFDSIPSIKTYMFQDLPCLRMIHLQGVKSFRNYLLKDPFIAYLFNTCDSSICAFGGNYIDYSKVISKSLSDNTDKEMIIRLIELYLNTLCVEQSYYIVNSINELKELFPAIPELEYQVFPLKELHQNIKSHGDKIVPVKVISASGYSQIEFFTFRVGDMGFSLEYFIFEVSETMLRLIDRYKVFSRLVD
ncbi:MAG: hypothetical protein GY839_10730 [candidate division Zixibacteria bacterium]|nr:hypothetical protein [candidate division Zixibacteria bacterium]